MYDSKGNYVPNDMNKLKAELAYICLWGKYSFFYLKNALKRENYKMLFISKYAPKVRYNIEIDVEQQFCRDMVCFSNVFIERSYAQQEEYIKQLKEEYENVNEMEKIFLELASNFCAIYRNHEKEVLEYAEEIAENILSFIEAFYGCEYYLVEDVHTSFLKDLCNVGMLKPGDLTCLRE